MSTLELNTIPEDDHWATVVDGELVYHWIIDGISLSIPSSNGIPIDGEYEDDLWKEEDGTWVWRIDNKLYKALLVPKPLNP